MSKPKTFVFVASGTPIRAEHLTELLVRFLSQKCNELFHCKYRLSKGEDIPHVAESTTSKMSNMSSHSS